MKKFEYKTISMPYPVSDKTMAREKKYEEDDREYARKTGVEYQPTFIGQDIFIQKLNAEGSAGWQVVGIYPSGTTTISVVMMRTA